MDEERISEAKRRVVDLLKRRGPATAAELAATLGLTNVALRQHLHALESVGLVRPDKRPAQGRGRPSRLWTLTESAAELFPDRHGELTVGLIDAMRRALGAKSLERVIQARSREQVGRYRKVLSGSRMSLKHRVEALAQQRTAEGYMAEVVTERPGSYLLMEHHCPICDAAKSCQRLCGAELEVFQQALGDDARVERTAHLLAGDDRCAYRVQKR